VSARLLGLFAHPDDEVFCVGGTFAQAARTGAETMIVSFTRGGAGRIGHADLATRATLGATRERELQAACRALGVEKVRCLDFVDGRLLATDRNELVGEAVGIIRDFGPDKVYSFDETGGSGHPDHIVISQVALAACELAGRPDLLPERGTPHAPSELLQARFPRNDRLLLRLLVDWLSGLDDRFRGSDEFMRSLLMFADGTSMLGYASDHLTIEWFPAGSYILEQGEPASDLCLVLSGSVDVVTEDERGRRNHVGTAGVGEFLGETGIATGGARNAHCIAAENTTCFVLSPTARDHHAARGAPASRATAEAAGVVAQRSAGADPGANRGAEVVVHVAEQVACKVEALAAHASQYVMSPGLFPQSMVDQLLGTEYFVRAWSADDAGLPTNPAE